MRALPPAYLDFVARLEALMREARGLGLYRTTEQLHMALNEARSEMFEAAPTSQVTIDFAVGPIREQR